MDSLEKLTAEYERRCASAQHGADDVAALAALRSARAHESMALGASVWHPVRTALGVDAYWPESELAAAVLRYIAEHPAKTEAHEPPVESAGIVWVADWFDSVACSMGCAQMDRHGIISDDDARWEDSYPCLATCPCAKAYLASKESK